MNDTRHCSLHIFLEFHLWAGNQSQLSYFCFIEFKVWQASGLDVKKHKCPEIFPYHAWALIEIECFRAIAKWLTTIWAASQYWTNINIQQ